MKKPRSVRLSAAPFIGPKGASSLTEFLASLQTSPAVHGDNWLVVVGELAYKRDPVHGPVSGVPIGDHPSMRSAYSLT